jgi:hypothetical protein
MKLAASTRGCEEEVMWSDQSHAGLRKVASVAMWCAGAWLGLWLGVSGVFARMGQDAGAIVVTGNKQAHETPFACSMEKSLSSEQWEHKKQLTEKMASARFETKELADGFVFRFRPEAVSFADLADWVATERVCCPFFDLAIEAERENGPLSLRITGRKGVKQFIRMGFLLLKVG